MTGAKEVVPRRVELIAELTAWTMKKVDPELELLLRETCTMLREDQNCIEKLRRTQMTPMEHA